MIEKYVFEVRYGGLGDHLFYTPLPRLLKELGIAKNVYLYDKSPIRNPETYDLVWKINPYLDGLSDAPPNLKNVLQHTVHKATNFNLAEHGVIFDHEIQPEIYAKELFSEKYSDKNYIDLNYISFAGAFTSIDGLIFLKQNPNSIMVNPSNWYRRWSKNKYVYTNSLLDYISLIASSASFTCLTSGGASLAAALGKSANVLYGYGHNPFFRHSINNHIQIGGDNFLRKFIANVLKNKNALRMLLTDTK
jgi:hypothetical protein